MVLAVTDADATVIVGVLSLIGVLATVIGVQIKVHRDNRSDHHETARKVDQLVETTADIAADVRDVKADVRDLKANDRSHDGRLHALEHPEGDAA